MRQHGGLYAFGLLLAVVFGATGVGIGVEAAVGASSPAGAAGSPIGPAPLRISSCGPPYTLVEGGRSRAIDSCAGMLGTTPYTLRLVRGRTFELDGATNANGTAIFLAPTSAEPGVVRRLAVSGSGADGRYEAVGNGSATLFDDSIFCNGGPVVGHLKGDLPIRRCPALRVDVAP